MSHRFQQITPTDHFGWHAAYLDVYEKLFAPFKEEAITLLEIGTDGGGGLRMYQDYFPKGRIVGVDVSPTPDAAKDQPRITHYETDAYTPNAVVQFKLGFHEFQVVIDDGPHTLGSQEFFCANYPALLAKDGILICEDIQAPEHAPMLQKCLPVGMSSMIVDLRAVNGRYDDLLLVAWK